MYVQIKIYSTVNLSKMKPILPSHQNETYYRLRHICFQKS